jgi:hypothetical protein
MASWNQLVAKAKFAAPAEVSTIDGLRVDWPDGFGLIRASNTTPVLVLRFEGHTPEALDADRGRDAGAAAQHQAGRVLCRGQPLNGFVIAGLTGDPWIPGQARDGSR